MSAITISGTERPDPHLESIQAAAYRAHKAAEEAFMTTGTAIGKPIVRKEKKEEENREVSVIAHRDEEDNDMIVLRVKKVEQVITLSFLTKKDKEVSLSIKVISLEETDTSFSLILPQNTLIKLPVLETFKLTLQNGAISYVSFLGGEGTIGNCKCIWLIKTNKEHYD